MTALVGVFIGYHDSNVAMLRDGEFRYRKYERQSGVKHERVTPEAILATLAEWGVQRSDPVAFSDGNWNALGICSPGELYCSQRTATFGSETWCVDHHFAHALSDWPFEVEPNRFTAVALDGKGDHGYRCRVFDVGTGLDAKVTWESQRFAVGDFFTEVGLRLGLDGNRVDMAGKVMGLQAYGVADDDFVEAQRAVDVEWLTSELLLNAPFRGRLPVDPDFYDRNSQDFLDWLASVHAAIGDAIVRVFEDTMPWAATQPLFVGGCAQNSVYNEQLARRFWRLSVPAHCYDGGISIGLVGFLARKYGLPLPQVEAYPFIQDDEDVGFATDSVCEQVARLVADGKVVGWMQGRGEVGPRALGHRSMLYDPRRLDAKDVLNGRVKFREPWRPFAASVVADDAAEWFEWETPTIWQQRSPWMQRALTVREEMRERVPGVVHVDGTCRAQTVEPGSQLGSYYYMLRSFKDLTGLGGVLNTSLNSGGEPIYGSAEQALALFAAGKIDAVCVGDKLVVR